MEEINLLIKILKHKILFAIHLFLYLAVMGLLILIWAVTGAGLFWPFLSIFGWGFAIGFHALVYLMYNNKVEYLSELRNQATFKVLFIFHAWFYAMINIFLIIINLVYVPQTIFFIWPLIYWGIAFGFHGLGFFLWENSITREIRQMKSKHSDFSEKKISLMAASKVSNFWIVIIHIGYYIAVNILLYTMNLITISDFTEVIEMTVFWGIILVVHIISYVLYYFIEVLNYVLKGLIIHCAFYGAINGWQLYEYYKNPSNIFWPLYPLVLWGIIIVYHAYIAFNWTSILSGARTIINKQYKEELEEYKLKSKARWLIFWKWSFISHITVWAVGIFLIGINFAIVGIQIGLLIHPLMGWLIAVSIHGSFFVIMAQNIRGFWKRTAIIHLAIFISTGVYLIILNAMTSIFPWSAIALAGWGIGLGLHLLLAYLLKK
jgi:hypothetical protein